ncbi:MAG TPA: 16S rRNA (guanine(527)-N(7))-methyltransferase RsmG [Anaerolineaceae bacterium]|nr:16S rRNA (guanine(527)-N(7))-methyltransferase RsmG [Anaerolineaceae bacterium]
MTGIIHPMEKLQREALKMLGIQLTRRQIDALVCFEHELIEWNSRFNLTAIREPEGIRTKHFLDSLTCLLAMRDAPPAHLIDVGTGAGFPGIPLKIVMPTMRLTLVESVGKKAEFCRHMVERLALSGVEVVQARAEEVGQMAAHREQYDWAVARAVATLPVLLEYLIPLVKVNGRVLAQKGESGPAEAHASDRALKLLGGRLQQLIPVTLPGVVDERYLIVVHKTAATPPAYPRRTGVPSKTPLI